MSAKKRTYLFITLALLVWGLLASLVAGYYYNSYNNLFATTQKAIIHVNIGLKNGSANITWFNGTSARAGYSLLTVTQLVANVSYSGSGPSTFVKSINNVANHGSFNWMWWTYTSYGWYDPPVGCGKYIVSDNETCLWYFQDTSSYPQLSPP
jgi:hypothetical protein